MTERLGVFATLDGWLLAAPSRHQLFDTWAGAIAAARRQAQLARWRGGSVEVVAQIHPGAPLESIDTGRRSDEPRR
jgi:hypothetical protein